MDIMIFYLRLVYKWFYLLYKLSYVLGVIGYVIMMATFFGLNLIFDAKPSTWMDVAVLFVFYGLYYGVLGRDISEICADKMAAHIGVCIILIYAYKNMKIIFFFFSIIQRKECPLEILIQVCVRFVVTNF